MADEADCELQQSYNFDFLIKKIDMLFCIFSGYASSSLPRVAEENG